MAEQPQAAPNARLPLIRHIAWQMVYLAMYAIFSWAFRYRAWGINNVPRSGPVLFVANHQSFLDPPLIGLGSRARPFHSMARATLWANRFFGAAITVLNAIPIDQEATDLKAMRRCMDVIKEGHALLIFPEGSRSGDGHVADFAPGTMVLIRRTRPMVVPVAIEGAFACWPRTRKLPRMGRIGVSFGEPIPAGQLLASDATEALARLRDEVEMLRQQVAHRLGGDHINSL